MKTIYEFNDYKSYLKYQIDRQRGEHTKIANAAQCQKAYLSRVIKAETHLTPDQAFRITEFWKMTTDERDYFITLLEIERAADNNYKNLLKQKANSIKEKNTKIKVITGREDAPISQQDIFYHSHWAILIIHILATSYVYRNVIQLQKKLELPNSIFEKYLNYLQDQKLIIRKGNELFVESGPKHIPKSSPALIYFLNLWRQKALMHLPSLDEQSIHYTNVQTISMADYEKLLFLLRNSIKEMSTISSNSGDEEVYVFNCDLFKFNSKCSQPFDKHLQPLVQECKCSLSLTFFCADIIYHPVQMLFFWLHSVATDLINAIVQI